ncbi:MAG: hypothetical protein M3442_11850, partial [Chloroflexota bacterium]|nr:hypothetical protein [Chloroflexota bacterium]
MSPARPADAGDREPAARPREAMEAREPGWAGALGGRRPFYGPAAPVLEGLFTEQGLTAGEWWPFLVQEEG